MRALLVASLLFSASFASSTAFAQGDDVGAAHEAVCCGSECCNVGGMCFRRGDLNPSNSCQMCDPGNDQRSFTAISGCGGRDAGPPAGGGGGCSVSARSTTTPLLVFGLVGLAWVGLRQLRRRR